MAQPWKTLEVKLLHSMEEKGVEKEFPALLRDMIQRQKAGNWSWKTAPPSASVAKVPAYVSGRSFLAADMDEHK